MLMQAMREQKISKELSEIHRCRAHYSPDLKPKALIQNLWDGAEKRRHSSSVGDINAPKAGLPNAIKLTKLRKPLA